jgi:hypothetical protein
MNKSKYGHTFTPEQRETVTLNILNKILIEKTNPIVVGVFDFDKGVLMGIMETILDDFKKNELIKKFKITEQTKMLAEPKKPEEPSDLYKEEEPEWFFEYQSQIDFYNEQMEEYISEYNETYFRIEINRKDIDFEKIKKLKTKLDSSIKKNAEDHLDKLIKTPNKILYRVTLEKRKIKINGIQIAKPNFAEENDNVFEILFNNPGKVFTKQQIESRGRIKKKLIDVVRGLGFEKERYEMFFDVSKDNIRFINPITYAYFKQNNLKPLKGIPILK